MALTVDRKTLVTFHITTVAFSIFRFVVGATSCNDPNVTVLDDMKARMMDMSWDWLSEASSSPYSNSDAVTEVIIGDSQFPPSKGTLQTRNSVNLCPSYRVQETDVARIPSVLTQVRCQREKSISKKIGKRKCTCKPVYRLIPVLRQIGCNSTTHTKIYRSGSERLSVACVCNLNRYSSKPKMPK